MAKILDSIDLEDRKGNLRRKFARRESDFEEWKSFPSFRMAIFRRMPIREARVEKVHPSYRRRWSQMLRLIDVSCPSLPPPEVYAEFFVLLPRIPFIEPSSMIVAQDHLNANIRFNLSSVSISFLGCPRCDAIYL